MKLINHRICGEGSINIILLHGWGLNAHIWSDLITWLHPYFRLYLIDLPGFGANIEYQAATLTDMVEYIIHILPKESLLLGWSLGGLIATKIALVRYKQINGLITVASSPCFINQKNWPGIKLETLINFQNQLSKDFNKTIEQFLILQNLYGVHSKNINMTNNRHLVLPQPSLSSLKSSLNILCNTDLRKELNKISCPFLRIYGSLDSLVPRNVVPLIDKICPQSKSVIIKGAAHSPFISHPQLFCHYLLKFSGFL